SPDVSTTMARLTRATPYFSLAASVWQDPVNPDERVGPQAPLSRSTGSRIRHGSRTDNPNRPIGLGAPGGRIVGGLRHDHPEVRGARRRRCAPNAGAGWSALERDRST